MAEENKAAEQGSEQQAQPMLQIQRIYVKDVSFEAPNLPHLFQQEWKQVLKFDLDTETTALAENLYEVVLNVSIETKLEGTDTVAFICEAKQAGIFAISGLEEMQLAHALTSQCPNMLFPYVRELVSNLVNRGTFPALNLAPVNFDALFVEYLQRQQAAQAEAEQQQKAETVN